jgi:hypothetical protein
MTGAARGPSASTADLLPATAIQAGRYAIRT